MSCWKKNSPGCCDGGTCTLDGGTTESGSWSYSAPTLTGSGVYLLASPISGFDLDISAPVGYITQWTDNDNNVICYIDSTSTVKKKVGGVETTVEDCTDAGTCETCADASGSVKIRWCGGSFDVYKDGTWKRGMSFHASGGPVLGFYAASSKAFSNLACGKACASCSQLVDGTFVAVDIGAGLGDGVCTCSNIVGTYDLELLNTSSGYQASYCVDPLCSYTCDDIIAAAGCDFTDCACHAIDPDSGPCASELTSKFYLQVNLIDDPLTGECYWTAAVSVIGEDILGGPNTCKSSESKMGDDCCSILAQDCTDPGCECYSAAGPSGFYQSACIAGNPAGPWTLNLVSDGATGTVGDGCEGVDCCTDADGNPIPDCINVADLCPDGMIDVLCSGSLPSTISISLTDHGENVTCASKECGYWLWLRDCFASSGHTRYFVSDASDLHVGQVVRNACTLPHTACNPTDSAGCVCEYSTIVGIFPHFIPADSDCTPQDRCIVGSRLTCDEVKRHSCVCCTGTGFDPKIIINFTGFGLDSGTCVDGDCTALCNALNMGVKQVPFIGGSLYGSIDGSDLPATADCVWYKKFSVSGDVTDCDCVSFGGTQNFRAVGALIYQNHDATDGNDPCTYVMDILMFANSGDAPGAQFDFIRYKAPKNSDTFNCNSKTLTFAYDFGGPSACVKPATLSAVITGDSCLD